MTGLRRVPGLSRIVWTALILAALPGPARTAPAPAGWDALLAGRHDQAREAFVAALESDSSDLDAAIGLAALLEARADTGGAVEVLARALAGGARGERGAGALARLATLVGRAPDGGAAAIGTLEGIAEGRIATDEPEVRALAALALADARANQGQAIDGLAQLARLRGRIDRWTVIGPWGRLSRRDLRQPFPPERCALDPAGEPAGPSGMAPRRVDVAVPDGRLVPPVPLAGIGVLYAVSDLEVDRKTDILLRIATSVSYRAFLDGQEVLAADFVRERPPIARALAVHLAPGRHRLMIKAASDEGGFALTVDLGPDAAAAGVRVVGPEGCPDATVSARPADPPLDRAGPAPEHDAALALARAWWLRARDLDRRSGRVLAALLEAAPEAPLVQYLQGEHLKNAATGAAASEDLTGARTWLERALAAAPDLLRASLLIAEIDEAAGRPEQVRERADAVLARSPDHPDALLLLQRLAARRGFDLEAARLLERARARAPGRTDLLAAQRDVLARLDALARLRETEDVLSSRNPFHPGPAMRDLAAGRSERAAERFAEYGARRPADLSLRIARATALVEAGHIDEALAELEGAERTFPGAAELAQRRAALLALRGADPDRIDRELSSVLERDPSRIGVRRSLELRRNDTTLRRYLADVPELLAASAPPPQGVDSALLADVAVVLLDRFGGQTELYQGVHRVYTRDGVEHEGELQVQPGAQLERLTIHKPDGRVVDVTIPDRPPINLPGLEPGDAFSYVWWRYIPAFPALPGALDSRSVFLFQGPDRQYQFSRYVILHPAGLKPSLCGNLEGLEVDEHTEGDLVIHSFTARDSPKKPLEPHVPDPTEIVPHVRISAGMSWEDLGELLRGRIEGLVLPDPPLPELVAEIRRRAGDAPSVESLARALHEVVNERLAPGAGALDLGQPASAAASAGEGNRALVAIALGAQLGLDVRLVLARPVEFAGRLLDCPIPGLFGYPLVEIDDGPNRYLLDYNDADHPFDTLPVRFGGSDGQLVPLGGDSPPEIVRLPWRDPGILEQVEADVVLASDGTVSGTITLNARGSLASVLRRMLREMPADRRPRAYETLATQAFAGARVIASDIEGLEQTAAPLVVRVGFEGGAFARPRPTGLALPLVTGRLPILEEYASLSSRTQPLLFDLQEFRRDVYRIRLPEGVEILRAPEPVTIEGTFGRYELTARAEGRLVEIERQAALPPRRVETDDYARFRDFARRVADAERAEVLLAVGTPSLESSGAR